MHPGSSWITQRALENAVLEYFEQLLAGQEFSFTYHSSTTAVEEDPTLIYKKELEKLNSREIRIREAYENEIDTLEEYKARKQQLQAERERLNDLILSVKKAPKNDETKDRLELMKKIQTVYDVIKSPAIDYEVKGTFIRSVVEEIVWNRAENTLSFHLYMPGNP